MKKVAFDCMGTLDRGGKVLKLFKWFESKGCSMVVWSSLYSFTTEQVKAHSLENVETMEKLRRYGTEEDQFVDVAVDDDPSQTYLAAKNFIWVHEIPNDESKFEELYGHLLESKEEKTDGV